MSKYKRKLYNADKINDFRELVSRYSNLYSDKVAFEYKKEPNSKEHIKITYGQFADDIKALGTALINLGLSQKKVAIISPNIKGAHSTNECVEIASIERTDKWLKDFISNYN